ncbi:hypothetical protein BDW74DRAFT_183647 [Aspergillus multicolor]|uniref:uncharacterized protein n=1 Tax=Aspergillus multicolor TaxID=41759 RepID=UPI003CCCFCA3
MAPDDPTFILTNDAARLPPQAADAKGPSGPWTDVDPVKTLTNTALVEAMMWLHLRYLKDKGYKGLCHQKKCNWLIRGSLSGERLRALRNTLKPEFRPILDAFQDDTEETPMEFMARLRPLLVARGEL